MQRIGIDCRFAGIPTGLGRYTRELVPALVQQNPEIDWVLFVRSAEEPWLQNIDDRIQRVVADIPHYSLAEQWRWPRIIRKSGLHKMFIPHFNVPLRMPVPYSMVIHDFILHKYPNQASFLKQWLYRLVLRRALSRARAVIAVSNFTASEARQYYAPLVSDKLHVVTEAVGPNFQAPSYAQLQAIRSAYHLPDTYFLYVGNAKQHKNVSLLLQAFQEAALPDASLLLVSPGAEADAFTLPTGVHRYTNVADDDLPGFYAAARAFVTASAYEGFCLPILEARACGCPVLAANTSAIPELAADGVQLVEPTVSAFADALRNFEPPERVARPERTWNDVGREVGEVLGITYGWVVNEEL